MPTFTEPKVVNDKRILPPYHVILLNDDDHTYEYVIHMLQTLFGHPQERGFQLAVEVDKIKWCWQRKSDLTWMEELV